MSGYVRYRAGAWRLRIEAGRDPATGRRRQVHRTVQGPDNPTGRRAAEAELARLLHHVATQAIAPAEKVTVAELLDRWIAHRSPRWSPSAAEATRARLDRHVLGAIGDLAIDRLRPIDLDRLYSRLEAAASPPPRSAASTT